MGESIFKKFPLNDGNFIMTKAIHVRKLMEMK